jgi:hypothetical protein
MTTAQLSGWSARIQAEHLDELQAQISQGGSRIALDFEEVRLVDIEVIRFSERVRLQVSIWSPLSAVHQRMDWPGTWRRGVSPRGTVDIHSEH